MDKKISAAVSLLLSLCLVWFSLPVFAEESGAVLSVSSASDLLTLAENCVQDSCSQGLTVRLETDIDLSGTAWPGIPIFSGTFDGGGHRITGLTLDQAGSVQGLFRYLTKTACVQDLAVEGGVTPQGSRQTVGGIAGSNAGTLLRCSFSGTVEGAGQVGGLAGLNTITGIVETCTAEGTVSGSHLVGGVVGENQGVVRGCTNEAAVNTTEQQNQVEISDITLETLTDSEAANTVTDIGGIAGSSSGVLRDCENHAAVGYQKMGYNIGGIAGSQSGYLTGCTNTGAVQGRKDVGGIVGQLEPAARLEYSADTLQILQGQMSTLNTLANQASDHTQSSLSSVSGQVSGLKAQAQNAREAISAMTDTPELPTADSLTLPELPAVDSLPEPGDLSDVELLTPEDVSSSVQLPDADSLLAAQNQLTDSLQKIDQAAAGLTASAQNSAATAQQDIQALTDQVNAIQATMDNADQTPGGSFSDVSDQDTDQDQSAKLENCTNSGAVSGDWNTGGMAGTIAPESELDTAESVDISGTESLHFSGEMRAVILTCRNEGPAQADKENAGGIAGWMTMGLVRDCANTGAVGADASRGVGGIAGRAGGFLRSNNAKCELTGEAELGGIAGRGDVVTGCLAMVRLQNVTEKAGNILGIWEQEDEDLAETVQDNCYLPVGCKGGIDGVSYAGIAQVLSREEFLALPGLPALFQQVTLTFVQADGSVQTVSTTPGGAIAPGDIPEAAERDGVAGTWAGLEEIDLQCVLFDDTFQAVYSDPAAVIASDAARASGTPVFLLQGLDGGEDPVIVSTCETAPPGSGDAWLESWTLPEAGESGLTVRYLPPDGYTAEQVRLMACDGTTWREVETTQDHSRLVATLQEGDTLLAVLVQQPAPPLWPAAAVCAVLLLAGIFFWRRHVHRRAAP